MPLYNPSGGSMTIGNPVVGGVAGRVLFIDAGGNLGQSAAFTWDDGSGILAASAKVASAEFRLTADGAAATPAFYFLSAATTGLYAPGVNRLGIATAGVARWEFSATGHFIAATDNAFDIGASTVNRPRTIYAATDVWFGANLRQGTGATAQWLMSVSGNAAVYNVAS